jgi:hypothetical protein
VGYPRPQEGRTHDGEHNCMPLVALTRAIS